MTIRKRLKKILLRFAIPAIRYARQIEQDDLPAFANTPRDLVIELPRRIFDADRMYIGDDVSIGPGALLVAQTYYPTEVMQDPGNPKPVRTFDPKITIGNRVTSSGGLTIVAMDSVTIEDDVMFASNVNIADGTHGYETAEEPYKFQHMGHIAPVLIKRGCWIGQNVMIMPGVTVGEMAIIGANSVVTRDIPARTIAVGAPARALKTWDADTNKWTRID